MASPGALAIPVDAVTSESSSPVSPTGALSPLSPTRGRSGTGSGKKVHAMLGLEDSPETEDSPGRNRRKGSIGFMLKKTLERSRSNSAAGSPGSDAMDQAVLLRERISELELQVFKLEEEAHERERVVEHYRAKFLAAKKTNQGIREQAKGMFKALLDGDSRKLDELIRSHYKKFEPSGGDAAKRQDDDEEEEKLTPRGTHFRAPEERAAAAFSSQGHMFTSHGTLPQASATTRNRGASDPRDIFVSPTSSPLSEKRLPHEPLSAAPFNVSSSGPSIQFRPGSTEIVRGSVSDIVDYLINVNRDREFLARFLLVYRQFMTPSDLIVNLKLVLSDAPQVEQQSDEAEDTVLYIQPMPGQSSVKQRVGYLLNRWLQDYFDADFRDNAPLRKSFSKVANDIDPSLLVLLDTAVEKSKEARRSLLQKQGQSMPVFSESPNKRSGKGAMVHGSFQLLALHPMEVARQMTLVDFDLLENVEPLDFLKASKDSNKATTVKGLTSHFNKTSAWVATEIIQNATAKERGQKIKFFISVAQAASEIKNFNLVMSILAGLNYSSVQRLKKSWKTVPAKLMQTFAHLEELMSNAKNYQAYRTALNNAEWPKLPYFGVFLRDLQFVDVGNDTFIKAGDGEQIVNFEKVTMLEALLQELDNYKTYNEFPFTAQPVLQSFLKILPSLDEEQLHKKSVAAEPITTSGPNYLEEEGE